MVVVVVVRRCGVAALDCKSVAAGIRNHKSINRGQQCQNDAVDLLEERATPTTNKQVALCTGQPTWHREAECIETSACEKHHCIPCRGHLGFSGFSCQMLLWSRVVTKCRASCSTGFKSVLVFTRNRGFCADNFVTQPFSGAMGWHVQSRAWSVQMHRSIQTVQHGQVGSREEQRSPSSRSSVRSIVRSIVRSCADQAAQEHGYVTWDIPRVF